MTDVQPELHNPTGCPVVDYADLNVPTAPAGWHFDNFDAKREEAPIHTGEGGPCPPTGKSVSTDYVYVMDFEGDRIRHMTKIWNAGDALQQLGWA